MFKNIWDDLVAHAIRDGIAALLSKAGKKVVETAKGKSASNDDREDTVDWNLIVNNDRILPFANRKILVESIGQLPPDEQDEAERAIGKVLTEAKTGYLPERTLSVMRLVTKQTRGGTTTTKEPSSLEAFPPGFRPEQLVREFLRDSTKTPDAAKLMLSLLLQKSRAEKAMEAARKATEVVVDKTVQIAKVYASVMLVLLALSIVFLVTFIVSPGPVKLTIALVAGALFTVMCSIFRLVPGESK